MTGDVTSRQIVPKSPACPEGLFLMDGIEGLRSLPKHSVDMLLTDPPYGTIIRKQTIERRGTDEYRANETILSRA